MEIIEHCFFLAADEAKRVALIHQIATEYDQAGAWQAIAAWLEEAAKTDTLHVGETIWKDKHYFIRSALEVALVDLAWGQNKRRVYGAWVAFKSPAERKRRGKAAMRIRIPHR